MKMNAPMLLSAAQCEAQFHSTLSLRTLASKAKEAHSKLSSKGSKVPNKKGLSVQVHTQSSLC